MKAEKKKAEKRRRHELDPTTPLNKEEHSKAQLDAMRLVDEHTWCSSHHHYCHVTQGQGHIKLTDRQRHVWGLCIIRPIVFASFCCS